MNGRYLSLEDFLKQNHPEPKNFNQYIIDIILSISAERTLEYLVVHRLPYEHEPHGKIFLQDFDDRRDLEHPYYQQLTHEIARISNGRISQSYPGVAGYYVITPQKRMEFSDVRGWIKEYGALKYVKKIYATVRCK